MATFKREWFNSETNYVKANYLSGHNPVRNWVDIVDSEGKPSFNDTTSNFSKIYLKDVKPATWNTYFNDSIIDCSKIDFGVSTATSTFSYTFPQPTELHNVKLTESINVYNRFTELYNLTYLEVTMNGKSNNILQCFRANPQLKTLILHNCQGCYNNEHQSWSTFCSLGSLTKFELWGWNQDLWLSGLTNVENWSRELFVGLFTSLATITTTKTITLGSTLLAKLTDEDKKIATDKGWTLA